MSLMKTPKPDWPSESTRRALRTAYQAVLALIAVIPVMFVTNGNTPATALTVVAAVGVMSKIVNALEDAGVIPAWLKKPTTDDTVADSTELAQAYVDEHGTQAYVEPEDGSGESPIPDPAP